MGTQALARSGKNWAPAETVGTFVLALHDLLTPQAHYCSGGQDLTEAA
jgi:hypothetical protein